MDPQALNGAQFKEFGISVPTTRSTGKWATDKPLPPPVDRFEYETKEQPGSTFGEYGPGFRNMEFGTQGTLGRAIPLPEPGATGRLRDRVNDISHHDYPPIPPGYQHDTTFYPFGHKEDIAAPDLESRTSSGYTLTSHTLGHRRRVVLAWHGDNAVGRLDISPPGDEEEGGPPTPEMISVHPDHRDKGLARSMFRFAQFTGTHEDPTRNLIHSHTRTPDGRKYSARTPDNPDEDLHSRVRWNNMKRSAQFHQGRLF